MSYRHNFLVNLRTDSDSIENKIGFTFFQRKSLLVAKWLPVPLNM